MVSKLDWINLINIQSCFDGMSCLQIALNRLGIEYDNYYASEIDKYAISVTQHNYPKTIQLGDITKWQEWDLPQIDLIAGGSPCQGFSFAGKGLNFDDPRSKLFFEFEKIVKHFNPKYWLLENVMMKQEYQDIISQRLGIKPIRINSALVSAQNRDRLYWTNIGNKKDLFGFPYCDIRQPEDKGIVLADIIENGIVDRQKSYCLDSNYQNTSESSTDRYFRKSRSQIVFNHFPNKKGKLAQEKSIKALKYANDKSNALLAIRMDIGKNGCTIINDGISWRKLTPLECERLQTVPDNFTLVLDENGKQLVSNSQRYKMLGNGWTVDVICHILKHMVDKTY